MISLTPFGHLVPAFDASTEPLPGLHDAFGHGAGHALLKLGGEHVGESLPAILGWWRDFAVVYLNGLCTLPDAEESMPGRISPPDAGEFQQRIWSAPPMDGGEYLSIEVLERLWNDLDLAFHTSLAESDKPLASFMKGLNPAWNLVGRVHLHLAENRADPALPFAFMATYTTRLTAQGKAQHRPLGEALREYAAVSDKNRLIALLDPLQRAGQDCPWLKSLLDHREIFQPLRWSAPEALALLRDVPLLERAGVVVRMPASWGARRPARPKVVAKVGSTAPSSFGAKQLLEVSLEVALDGEPLTGEEIADLLAKGGGLVLFRGKWIELDASRLDRTLEKYREIERLARERGLGFHEAMRLLAGVADGDADGTPTTESADWGEVAAGPWLAKALAGLRDPNRLAEIDPGQNLKATLRPYQQVGLRWLHFLAQLGFGACLADDMGLGKTIQVLALLLSRKQAEGPAPNLLVVPASLLSNWAQEAARFAPSLRVLVSHPSMQAPRALEEFAPAQIADHDLVIVTYGSLHKLAWLSDIPWRLLVLDEAQAIKNAGTRQTKAAKAIGASSRIAMTGTPVENHLGDLWSIFDFLNPGLLGAAKPFAALVKRLEQSPQGYAPLRRLVQPYILRRLKTDRTVIDDLPDKTELTAYCGLSRRQAALYQKSVTDLAEELENADGLARKGLVLAFLTRFKQICNHPSHWLKDDEWTESDSGKFARLREISEVVASRGEKLLVFSQFAEATGPLGAFLQSVMGRPGCILTGATPIKARRELVRRFQEDDLVPFFVLSLKAGGSGLNLTAASHVVHFDRWWNPAVENQATDRAFRIGQKRNVLVHKFVCKGTVEERIDDLIADKRELATRLLDDAKDGGLRLTEMSNEELLATVRLDLHAATAEVSS